MDELRVVLEKKYEIYVIEEETEELEHYDRIPVELHDPIRDLSQVMATVEKYGFCLISDIDSGGNVKLFLRSNFQRNSRFLKYLLVLLHLALILTSTYLLLIKLGL